MPREGTKAAKIMELYERGDFTTREIADAVGCAESYVRVVTRQRRGTGVSKNERRYLESALGQSMKRKRQPAINAYNRVLRKTGDHTKAREAYRAMKAGIEAAHAA